MAGYRERIFKDYQDTIAPELEMGTTEPGFHHEGYRERYLPHLPADKGARIVDIGCGHGDLVAFFLKEGYSKAAGVDSSPQMVKLAKDKGLLVEQNEAVAYLRAHAGQLDCVTAMDVLEHMHKDELIEFMDAVRAALKPGGVFLAHTVNADGLSWGRMRYIDLTHETAFTRYSLSQLFTVTGFTKFEFYATPPLRSAPRACFKRMIWKIYRLVASLYYHAEMGSGICHNDHILSASIVAKAVKP